MTREEYDAKYTANTKITGGGLDTAMHMPCPGCAEPDWLIIKVLVDMKEKMAAGAECTHCHRSFRGIYEESPSSTKMELVQTGGDDIPDFLPKIRRV
jgi:hypothetical protein